MNVGIIGGGTMGLTLAYRLGQAGQRVTVFEAAPEIGGLATYFDYGDFVWDKFYHVILRSDRYLLGLIDDLGISSRMRWSETRTGFLWNGRHLSMSNNWEFLKFPALTFIDKIRLAAGILYVQRIEDPTELERTKASVWMERIFGHRVYAAIWEPLLESKYGVLKDQMPATIMWATIKRYYSTRSKGGGRESMGFLSGGLKTFYDALDQAISSQGSVIRRSTPVSAIDDADPTRVIVRTAEGEHRFDRVISTLPTEVLRRIVPQWRPDTANASSRPQFLGVICLSLVLKRPLSPYYVTNLIQKGFPFTGIIGVTNLTGPEEHGGRHLVMLPRYDVPDSPWFSRSAEEIASEFIAHLKPIWPDIEENIVRWFVNRERLVQAIWISNPPQLQGPSKNSAETIWSVNAELAGRDTLNNNAIVKVADEAAAEFLRSISSSVKSSATTAENKVGDSSQTGHTGSVILNA